MLPGVDGWTVLRELRERKQTPVLFLTARDDVADRVKGLELGADDYLVKPFAFSELLARVRSVLRRGGKVQSERLSVGDLEIDPRKRRVSRARRKSSSPPRSLRCSIAWCATAARSCRARSSPSRSGT